MSTRLLTQVRKLQLGPGWVLEGERKVGVGAGRRKAVLYVLCCHANDEGYCRVSQYTLSSETEIPYGTLRRVLLSLEREAIIERQHRHGRLGFRVADEIRVRLPPSAHGGNTYCPPDGRALEAPLRSVSQKSPALLGPGLREEEKMRVVDLRDEGASPYLDEAPKKAPPTKPKAPRKRPGQQNPVTLAQYFANRARVHQWGHASPATIRELAGTFRRWRDEHGVSYREMATATDLFFEEFPADCEAPAGRVFIKQGFQWIAAAKGTIWDEELPKLQALNEQMWDEIYAEYDPLVAAHPEWSELERDALLSKLYNEKRDLPAYAACYA